ncbi:MAG: response regulator transcription factor [Caldilineaceae bacterium]|nr:response regulator transcription factor [Caldilineaceae bacterium]
MKAVKILMQDMMTYPFFDQFESPSEDELVGLDRPIRVMIVEDHPLMTQGLRRVVEVEDSLEIVAEVDNGDDAVRTAKRQNPDVILMDINLPGKNGLQATREIKSDPDSENISIIVLTAYNDDEQLFHALRAGASAYYPKDVRPSELLPAIHAVATNRCVIHDEIMSKSQAFRWLIRQLETFSVLGDATEEMFTPLSPREMEILSLITRGASNKEIARSLEISRQTVKNHMSSVLRKLGVEDRTQAAVLALRRGWVRLEDTSK